MKQCGTKIITRKIVCDIPSPSYNGLCFDLKGFTLIHHKFLFWVDDLIHCVRGIRRKYCVNKPLVPSTWSLQVGINLSQIEVITLEKVGFVLWEVCKCVPWTLFANESLMPRNQLANLEAWPKICNNNLFGEQQHSSFQCNKQIGGRLDKLWRMLFCHLLKFFHQDVDKSTSSVPFHLFTQSSMRWQLEISLIAFRLTSYKWWQVFWVVGGSRCIANISISSCKMWCIIAKQNLSFISQHGVGMKC
jgi:hypothetical protein